MREEFTIDRQGKTFVLYAGLLDAAHAKGLKSITTEMKKLQVDDNGNAQWALFKAVVTLEDGETFEGWGDATAKNVGRNIVPHLIRMAETRAKARALRDAVNVGMATLEELGGEDDEEKLPTQHARRPEGSKQQKSSGQAKQQSGNGGKMRAGTLEELQGHIWEWGGKENGVERFERDILMGKLRIINLSESKARGAIEWLKEQPKQATPPPAPSGEQASSGDDFEEEDFDEIDLDSIDGIQKGGAKAS